MEKAINKIYSLIFGDQTHSSDTIADGNKKNNFRKKVIVVILSLTLIIVFIILISLNILKRIQLL